MEFLQNRGLVYQTSEGAGKFLQSPQTVYLGIDPTSDSLHLGHLLLLIALRNLQLMGHRPICLLGGATALIGDPSGKSKERPILSTHVIEENIQGIFKNLKQFLDFDSGENQAVIVNNIDWYSNMNLLSYFRDVGRYMNMQKMLQKESVSSRLTPDGSGMSLTEFSYQSLQAYDFLQLQREYTCCVQIGGSDQWGNITAGIDFIRKVSSIATHAVTCPLLTTSDGSKFGKSEGNAIWLSKEKTSPFELYQYMMRINDNDVERFLKLFTFLNNYEIMETVTKHMKKPEKRIGQKLLAENVTKLVHGKHALDEATRTTSALYGKGKELKNIAEKDILIALQGAPTTEIPLQDFLGSMVGALAKRCSICKSVGAARRLISSGGMYINGRRLQSPKYSMSTDDLINHKLCLLRVGKKKYYVIKVMN